MVSYLDKSIKICITVLVLLVVVGLRLRASLITNKCETKVHI